MGNFDWGDYENTPYSTASEPESTPDKNTSNFEWGDYEKPEEKKKKPPKESVGVLGTIKDVAEQSVKKAVVGAAGTAGSLLDIFGARKGPLKHLPTAPEVNSAIESLGGPGEAKTPLGRYSGRATETIFGASSLGAVSGPALIAGVASSIAGQTVEEFGGGPLAQAAAEIATMIASRKVSAPKASALITREIAERKSQLKALGFTDQDIALAISAESKLAQGSKTVATKSSATRQAFDEVAENSGNLTNDLIQRSIPGFEKGAEFLHKQANNAYGHVAQAAVGVPLKDPKPFTNVVLDIIDEIGSQSFNKPHIKEFLENLVDAGAKFEKAPTADKMINIYKQLNSVGNWSDRKRQEALITAAKNGLKETLGAEGKIGRNLLTDFEKVNLGVQNAYKASDALKVINQACGSEAWDFKKMAKIFENPKNRKILEDGLGVTETRNLSLIARTAKQIGDFDKAWKATNRFSEYKNFLLSGAAGAAVFSGRFMELGAILSVKGGSQIAGKLAELSLRSPRFQNIQIRAQHALKVSSPQQLQTAQRMMEKLLKDEGIDINE